MKTKEKKNVNKIEKLQNVMIEICDLHGLSPTMDLGVILRYLYKGDYLNQDEIDKICSIIGTGWMNQEVTI